MALRSLVKSSIERLTNLLTPTGFFHRRNAAVIGSLRYLDEALDAQVKSPFFYRPNLGSFFALPRPGEDHSSKRENIFHEAALYLHTQLKYDYGYDLSLLSSNELKDFEAARQKLNTYAEIVELKTNIRDFILDTTRVTSIRRYLTFNLTDYPDLEQNIIETYYNICEQLNDYPEWKEKFVKEAEPKIKIMLDQTKVTEEAHPSNQWRVLTPQKYFK